MYNTPYPHLFEGALLEVEADHVLRSVRIVCSQNSRQLLFQLFLGQLQLVGWWDKLLGLLPPSPISLFVLPEPIFPLSPQSH